MTTPTTIHLPESIDLTDLDWNVTECELMHSGEFEWLDGDDPRAPYGESIGMDAVCYGICTIAADSEYGRLQFTFPWIAEGECRGSYTDMWDFTVRYHDDDPSWEWAHYGLTFDWDEYDRYDTELQLQRVIQETCAWEASAEECLPSAPEPEDIDTEATQTGDGDMKTITLTRENDRDIRFVGEEIASASSFDPEGSAQGRKGRWTELTLYRTQHGKFVLSEVGRTRWQGERDRFDSTACDDEQAVIAAAGHGWLAKELYAEAGIEDIEEV